MKFTWKPVAAATAALIVMAAAFTGCGSAEPTASAGNTTGTTAGATINVVSREDGSGTRGAFVELFEILEKDEAGNKIDKTKLDASITNSTAVMMTNIANDPNAIGYISLGSLNDTVKAVKIDGEEASAENIKDGDYKVSRPFNLITGANTSEVAQDFLNYILSSDGQSVVEGEGYIASVEKAKAFKSNGASGKIVVAGSSSVSPVLESLKEAYLQVNKNAEIEIQTSDSTTGINSARDGICDIGMASRELKDEEKNGLTATVIAIDGIAVIVNNTNTVGELDASEVKDIYTGAITDWSQVQ